MPREKSPHEKFVLKSWAEIRMNDFLDIHKLRGQKANNPQANNLLLGLVPFSKPTVPHSERLRDTYGEAPHAVIRIAVDALLAFVKDQRFDPDGQMQALVALTEEAMREVAVLHPEDKPMTIGRLLLNGKTGGINEHVSRQHFMVGAFGNSWFLQDLNSRNGTMVAVEAGTGLSPGNPSETHVDLSIEDILRQEEAELDAGMALA